MEISYKKLWKLLVDKEMSNGDLHKAIGLLSSTMTKLRRSEVVSMEALLRGYAKRNIQSLMSVGYTSRNQCL